MISNLPMTNKINKKMKNLKTLISNQPKNTKLQLWLKEYYSYLQFNPKRYTNDSQFKPEDL